MAVIRLLTARDSMAEYLDLRIRAFGPGDEERILADAQAAIAGQRCLAAFDDGHLIGVALFFDLRQWWLGRAVPMAGVGGVKVAPEYRAKGVGRALMTGLTQLMAERGHPLSALYAATAPFYRRLGWEQAGAVATAAVPARSLLSLARPDLTGAAGAVPAVRRAGPDDAAEVIAALGCAHEVARDCGPVTFDQGTVRQWLTAGRWAGKERYAYLADDGFLAYRWHGGHGEIVVDKLVAVSPETTRALWSVVASHSSVARTIRAQVAPADPIWWLLREQDIKPVTRYWWMLRALDAPGAIAARGFPAVDIEVPLHIADDQIPANTGSWMLTVRSGAGSLERSAGPASAGPASAGPASAGPASARAAAGAAAGDPLRLGARGLAALYAGTPVATLRRAALAAGGSPGSDVALDSAFAATPFMLDAF
jgi:predicted acetyltransferase